MLSKTPTGRIPGKATAETTRTKSSGNTGVGTPPAHASSTSQRTFSRKISQLHECKVVAPLGNDRHKTAFAAVYAKGGIPCRLQHGSVKHKLSWQVPPSSLDYAPLLVTFFEGLRETDHPYTFVVREGIRELLSADEAATKTASVLSSLVSPLRAALSQRDTHQFLIALEAFVMLSKLVRHEIVPFLGAVLPPIAARALAHNGVIREAVQDALAQCQIECGDAALRIIRTRVPTFAPLML